MFRPRQLAVAALAAAALAGAPRAEARPVGVFTGYGGVGVYVGGYRPGFYSPGYYPYAYRPYYSGYYGWGWGLPWWYGTFYSNPAYYANYYVGPTYRPYTALYPSAYAGYYPSVTSGGYYSAGTPVGTYQSLYPPTNPANVAPVAPQLPARTLGQNPNAVLVDVRLPDPGAQLLIDGTRTTRLGTDRQFISPPLEPGRKYSYEIEARWTADGKEVSQKRKVIVQAGQTVGVDFTRPPQPGEEVGPKPTPP